MVVPLSGFLFFTITFLHHLNLMKSHTQSCHFLCRALHPLLLLIVFLFPVHSSAASLPSHPGLEQLKCRLYETYVKYDLPEWEKVIVQLENGYRASGSIAWLEELAWASYGLTAFYIKTGNNARAGYYLDKAAESNEKLLKLSPRKGDYLAMQSSLTAFRLNLSLWKAPVLGPRSMRLMARAYEAEPVHPRVMIEKANSLHYAPSIAGGDPEKALGFFRKALEKMESAGDSSCNWYYLNALAAYGLCLETTGRYAEAEKIYEKALRLAPGFHWAKTELLPRAKAARR